MSCEVICVGVALDRVDDGIMFIVEIFFVVAGTALLMLSFGSR